VALILIYVGANIRTLDRLTRELTLLERQQTRRLMATQMSTNTVITEPGAANKPARP
jgi:hypothetical protein